MMSSLVKWQSTTSRSGRTMGGDKAGLVLADIVLSLPLLINTRSCLTASSLSTD
jgi:hypothetical protein